jgi:glutamate-5-semialdehyde dehydrogenase
MVKRLDLSIGGKFDAMCQGVLDVMDPLGRVSYRSKMDEGLELRS